MQKFLTSTHFLAVCFVFYLVDVKMHPKSAQANLSLHKKNSPIPIGQLYNVNLAILHSFGKHGEEGCAAIIAGIKLGHRASMILFRNNHC